MKNEKSKVYDLYKQKHGELINQKKYSVFLKRKRLEKKLTLEYLADGVCAISYLSRIENNLVEVSEEYFVKLFNKLDVDFYSLKETKENEIFGDLLKCFLLNDENKAMEIIEQALKTNFYVDLEYDLMVLYDNIIKKLYREARIQIIELNKKIDVLMDNELTFYLFLTALYTFRTNQVLFAYKQILILCEIPSLDIVYQYAIYDLALDVFEYLGIKELFYKYYQKINNDNYLTMFSNNALKHRAQMLYTIYSLNSNETLNALSEIKINLFPKYQEEIDWLIIKNEYCFSKYERCLDYIHNAKITPRTLAMEAIILLRNEDNDVNNVISKYNKIIFTDHDYQYQMIYELFINIKMIHDHQKIYSIMKNLLYYFNEVSGEDFFFEIITNIFIELSLKFGKYKDCLKTLLDIKRNNPKNINFL